MAPPGRWLPAYIGVGSNLHDPRQQVHNALELLSALPEVLVVRRSRLYRSPPMGPPDQPDYVNAVAAVLTRSPARMLLEALKSIERAQGREADPVRWGPRIIDLDLLVYGSHRVDETGLTVPHRGIAERDFVLRPLADVSPLLEVPGLGRVSTLLARLPAGALRVIDGAR